MPPNWLIRNVVPMSLVLAAFVAGMLVQSERTTRNAEAANQADAASVGATPVADAPQRVFHNTLREIENPQPLLADYPEFIQPIVETRRFEAPRLVNDDAADLEVRAWRFSYNARGIIEMPNRIEAKHTAVIVVHPWGIDDGQGWRTPEPAGVCDFCTEEKNHFAARHTRQVINPFLVRWRSKVALTMYSLIGKKDPIRTKMYRTFDDFPTPTEREAAKKELHAKLNSFDYTGESLTAELKLSSDKPVIDYFRQFPGLDASARYNRAGFWELPVPVTTDIDVHPNDVLIFDVEGYQPLKQFLQRHGVRHVLLAGYATDMCFCKTTAGYENLSKDFNVFLVGDATLATYPANNTPKYATNAHISFAAIDQLVTQVSWIRDI